MSQTVSMSDNVCTKDEVKEIVDQEVPRLVNRELVGYFKNKLWAIVITLFIMGSGWGVLAYQVKLNTDARSMGDRFTAADGEHLQEQIDRLRSDVKEDIGEIKASIKVIEQYIINGR